MLKQRKNAEIPAQELEFLQAINYVNLIFYNYFCNP